MKEILGHWQMFEVKGHYDGIGEYCCTGRKGGGSLNKLVDEAYERATVKCASERFIGR